MSNPFPFSDKRWSTILTVAAPLYVSWRIWWAGRMPIMDCDEVYNYWEPLSFIMMMQQQEGGGGGGKGMQTWEYAQEYALRTYAYLWPLAHVIGPALQRLIPFSMVTTFLTNHVVATDSIATFVLLRAFLAGTTGVVEVLWLQSLWKTETVEPHVVGYTGLVLCTAAGMVHAAGEYLPSSTWMGVWLVCCTAFLYQQHCTFCAVAIAATLAIGWPFGVVLLVPMALRILWREGTIATSNLVRLLAYCVLVTLIIQGLVSYVDHHYYGKWTFPTLNIFTYNAAGGGDELYGTEPASYYVKNLVLNLNMAAPLGIVVLPMLIFTQLRDNDLVVLFLPLYLWLAITVPRPHKEERFLYPIYPLLCLGAVVTVDKIGNFLGRCLSIFSRHKALTPRQRHGLHIVVCVLTMGLSLSRTAALTKYYSAPLQAYASLASRMVDAKRQTSSLNDSDNSVMTPTLVCTCGEWYRFPSSFFLPGDAQLAFVKSSFTGQLPQPFSVHGSRPKSQAVLQPFNDQNKEEPSRYVSLDTCDWIVDLEDGDCTPPDNDETQSSTLIASFPFLDASRTSALHRILYIPYLHEKAMRNGKVHYQNYLVYEIIRKG